MKVMKVTLLSHATSCYSALSIFRVSFVFLAQFTFFDVFTRNGRIELVEIEQTVGTELTLSVIIVDLRGHLDCAKIHAFLTRLFGNMFIIEGFTYKHHSYFFVSDILKIVLTKSTKPVYPRFSLNHLGKSVNLNEFHEHPALDVM